ncbi:hypothetical protein ACS8XF_003053, partial [Escherichia coli]
MMKFKKCLLPVAMLASFTLAVDWPPE